ncbi:MAG: hypothetical protein E7100_09435 [Bacteroidaceae bacterium]|nr:hypothetical protein [Bacteroidaceae bacterium]
MKYISRILFTVGLVFGLTACTEDAYETTVPELPAKGEMSVNLTFAMPDAEAQTRSMVSGVETLPVQTMQMVCFDANGLYLGIRNATITPTEVSGTFVDTGVIKGTVPQGTSRIHFIANRNLSIPLNATVGTPESEVMNSEELSTIYQIGKGETATKPGVCYWGYHKAANANEMEGWLNPKQGNPSQVYLIRDRAKVVLTYTPNQEKTPVPVTKIEWLLHNGLERGYLAPKETSWWDDNDKKEKYIGPSDKEDFEGIISTAVFNPYKENGKDGKRYSLWTSATENAENPDVFEEVYNINEGGNLSAPQYLFDDDNTDAEPIKAILRVTYDDKGTPVTVYHVLKLNDDNKVQYDVVRNNTYYIDVSILNPNVGFYQTLEKAIQGEEFINADIEVDRNITSVNDEDYTLQILLPTETTSIVFNSETTYSLDFAFRMASDVTLPGSTNPEDFEVYWEFHEAKDGADGSNDFCTKPTLSYVEGTKQFMIKTTVKSDAVTDELQDEWIVVRHKASGLKRYIHVFVIDQFNFFAVDGQGNGKPTLRSVGDNRYVLNFRIPPTESDDNTSSYIYPSGLYPIDVKFTTNTLKAYGTTKSSTDEYGLFSVAVEPTLADTDKHKYDLSNIDNFETGYNDPISSTNYNADRTHWYFQQESNPWDFWYTYTIKKYEQTNNGEVNIYFEDVTDNIKYADVNEVGLFMEIKYFGKIYSIKVTQ